MIEDGVHIMTIDEGKSGDTLKEIAVDEGFLCVVYADFAGFRMKD